MSVARVRTANTYGGSGTSIGFTNMTNGAGNFLVCFIEWEDVVTTVTVSDSANGAWTVLTHKTDAAPKGVIAYRQNVAGSSTNTITVTFAASVPFSNVLIAEYSGIATASAFDVEAQGSSGGGSTAALSTGNMSVTDGGLLFQGMGAYSSVSFTEGSSNGQAWVEVLDSASNPTAISEMLNKASGTYAGAATIGSANNWVMCAAAFKAAGGGGGGRTSNFLSLLGVS